MDTWLPRRNSEITYILMGCLLPKIAQVSRGRGGVFTDIGCIPSRQEHTIVRMIGDPSIAIIASKIRKSHSQKTPWRVYHGRTHSIRQSKLQRNASVDTSDLSHVMQITCSQKILLVELNGFVDALVRPTLAHAYFRQ